MKAQKGKVQKALASTTPCVGIHALHEALYPQSYPSLDETAKVNPIASTVLPDCQQDKNIEETTTVSDTDSSAMC